MPRSDVASDAVGEGDRCNREAGVQVLVSAQGSIAW